MSNLSELLPAGGGQNNFTFTASGAISNGDTIIVNSDNTVSAVSSSATGVIGAIGTATSFDSNATHMSGAYDPINKIVLIAYDDNNNSSYGTAVVGTISGNTITFGTPVVFLSNTVAYTSTAFDSTAKKFVVGHQGGIGGYATLLTVSGTSITVNQNYQFTSSAISFTSVAYSYTDNITAIAFRNGAGTAGAAVGATVSGTSISTSSVQYYTASVSSYTAVAFDESAGKFVFVAQDGGNNDAGTAVVGTWGGGSFSFGTPVTYDTSGLVAFNQIAYDASAQKVVIAWTAYGNNQYATAIVGTVSGTSISFGTSVVFGSYAAQYPSVTYCPLLQRVFAFSKNNALGSPYPSFAAMGKVSGSSISFGSSTQISDGSAYNSAIYIPDKNKVLTLYQDPTSTSGVVNLVEVNNYNFTDAGFIGLAAQAISDTATGSVNTLGSLNESQSGLTIGSDYYAYRDGSLVTSPVGFDIGGGAYDNKSVSVAAQIASPSAVAISADGTAMYVLDLGSPYNVAQYTLATAYDVSTATYASKSFSVSSQETSPRGMTFKPDGTKFYVIGSGNKTVYEYTLSTAWDISTASYSGNSFLATGQSTPCGLGFNSAGTRLFIVDQADDDVHQYNLSTGFDLSTASASGNVFDGTNQDSTAQDMFVSPDGTKFFILGNATSTVYRYDMATAGDLSTASYTGLLLYFGSQASGSGYGLTFSQDGLKMYVSGGSSDFVYQYTASTAYTDNKVGKAISATTINMKNRS